MLRKEVGRAVHFGMPSGPGGASRNRAAGRKGFPRRERAPQDAKPRSSSCAERPGDGREMAMREPFPQGSRRTCRTFFLLTGSEAGMSLEGAACEHCAFSHLGARPRGVSSPPGNVTVTQHGPVGLFRDSRKTGFSCPLGELSCISGREDMAVPDEVFDAQVADHPVEDIERAWMDGEQHRSCRVARSMIDRYGAVDEIAGAMRSLACPLLDEGACAAGAEDLRCIHAQEIEFDSSNRPALRGIMSIMPKVFGAGPLPHGASGRSRRTPRRTHHAA